MRRGAESHEESCKSALVARGGCQKDLDFQDKRDYTGSGKGGSQKDTSYKVLVKEVLGCNQKIRVSWLVCSLRFYEPPESYYKCFEQGHNSWTFKDPDKSTFHGTFWRKFGEEGYISRKCRTTVAEAICLEPSSLTTETG